MPSSSSEFSSDSPLGVTAEQSSAALETSHLAPSDTSGYTPVPLDPSAATLTAEDANADDVEIWLVRVPRHEVLRKGLVGKEISITDLDTVLQDCAGGVAAGVVKGNYIFRDHGPLNEIDAPRPVFVQGSSDGSAKLQVGKQFSRFVSVSFNAPIRRMDVAAPARAYPEIAATQKVQYIPIGPHKMLETKRARDGSSPMDLTKSPASAKRSKRTKRSRHAKVEPPGDAGDVIMQSQDEVPVRTLASVMDLEAVMSKKKNKAEVPVKIEERKVASPLKVTTVGKAASDGEAQTEAQAEAAVKVKSAKKDKSKALAWVEKKAAARGSLAPASNMSATPSGKGAKSNVSLQGDGVVPARDVSGAEAESDARVEKVLEVKSARKDKEKGLTKEERKAKRKAKKQAKREASRASQTSSQ